MAEVGCMRRMRSQRYLWDDPEEDAQISTRTLGYKRACIMSYLPIYINQR